MYATKGTETNKHTCMYHHSSNGTPHDTTRHDTQRTQHLPQEEVDTNEDRLRLLGLGRRGLSPTALGDGTAGGHGQLLQVHRGEGGDGGDGSLDGTRAGQGSGSPDKEGIFGGVERRASVTSAREGSGDGTDTAVFVYRSHDNEGFFFRARGILLDVHRVICMNTRTDTSASADRRFCRLGLRVSQGRSKLYQLSVHDIAISNASFFRLRR